jgi:hypothetical protein
MIGMFYERQITSGEVAQIIVLRNQFKRSDVTAKFTFWDDRHQSEKIQSFQEAMDQGDLQFIKSIATKAPMSLARFIRHIESIEKKYAHHEDDRIKEVFGDGGAVFHLNNINGWHP